MLKASSLSKKQLNNALGKSKKLKIPFTQYLISEKMIQKDELSRIISKYAEFMIEKRELANKIIEIMDRL